MTKFRVLGCSGGIGARARTTSFLLDDDILIDAGTGVEDLPVNELAAIDHVFLTHSHLDHIAALPLLVDSVGALRKQPIVDLIEKRTGSRETAIQAFAMIAISIAAAMRNPGRDTRPDAIAATLRKHLRELRLLLDGVPD